MPALRLPAPTGQSTIVPDNTSVHGLKLFFQELDGSEARYRGTRTNQICLVRETALGDQHATDLLRWEKSLLERLSHPLLPELVETFEHEDHYYLVTVFPEGLRLDQKMAFQSLEEPTILGWGQVLYDLVEYLTEAGIHLDLAPDHLIKTKGGALRLMDLRATERSLGHPSLNLEPDPDQDLITLGRCLLLWLGTTPSPAGRELCDQLLSGKFKGPFPSQKDAHTALGPPAAARPPEPPSPAQRRIPLEDGSSFTCLAPGTRLAGYEVRFYTRGGMSLCYLGKLGSDTRFIKEVKLDDVESAQSLRREFEIMKGLKHPHIVRAHQIFELGGYLYLVMDYIEGTSLASSAIRTLLSEAGPAVEGVLLDWGRQLCETLQYLHQQKPPLIYRDLKPGNIVLSPLGQLFLIDFGLARTYKVGQNQDTQALGTFSTASPEHFTAQTDARSDIYTLGATLYLLANPGFKPSAPFSFPPLRKAVPSFSEGFELFLRTCTQHSPDGRFRDAKAAAAEVKRLYEPYKAKAALIASAAQEQAWVDEVGLIPNLTAHVAVCARQLATLVQAGTALPHALQAVSKQTQIKGLSKVYDSVAAVVNSGQSLSSALRRYPKVFSTGYLDLVISGEGSDRMAVCLNQAATLLEMEDKARRTRSALADTNPLEATDDELASSKGSSRLITLVVAGLALALGGGMVYSLRDAGLPTWKPIAAGAAVSLGVGLVAVFVSAVRDARQLRLVSRAQNLVEDAWTSYALGDTDKAEKELGEALVMARDKLGPTHLTTLMSLHSLANLCRQRRQFAKAHDYYQQALSIYQRVLPPNHSARAHLHHHWALNFEGLKDIPKSLEQLELSLAVWREHSHKHPLELAEVQFYKGRLHFDKEENTQALELFSQALELQNAKLGLKSPLVHTTMSYLTRVYVRLRLFKESETHLANLLVELEQNIEPDYPALAEANLDMGLIRLEQDRGEEAEPYFIKALQLLQHYVGPHERLLKRVLEGYRAIYGVWAEQEAGVVQLASVFLGEREKIRQALEKHPEWVNARDNTGWGPIQWATFLGRDDIVRWLLARGADPGYDATHVMGALHVACAWDQPDVMFVLLETDPDVNAGGPGGWTPVFWCALTGRVRLLEILLKRGANAQIQDEYGRTPLHIAAARNHLKLVAALLGAGALVNAKETHGGATPLHLAAERGHLAVCDCLIYNGAQVAMKDEAGQTALDLAIKNQHQLLARAMRKHLQAGLGKAAK